MDGITSWEIVEVQQKEIAGLRAGIVDALNKWTVQEWANVPSILRATLKEADEMVIHGWRGK